MGENDSNSDVCPNCGVKMDDNTMICYNCGYRWTSRYDSLTSKEKEMIEKERGRNFWEKLPWVFLIISGIAFYSGLRFSFPRYSSASNNTIALISFIVGFLFFLLGTVSLITKFKMIKRGFNKK